MINSSEAPYFRVWLIFFVYTAIVAAFVQIVALPYLFPDLHHGHGLLKGLDAPNFHKLADRLAKKIETTGWSAWTLRPSEQGISGVVAAIYVLTYHEPWVIIPLNAFLHASAGLLLFMIICKLTPVWRHAFVATLPLIIFPSAMTWYAQIHKDGFTILGSMLFIYGWILLADPKNWKEWFRPFIASVNIISGTTLIWMMRPYHVKIMLAVSALVFLGVTIMAIVQWMKYIWPLRKTLKVIGLMLVILAIVSLFTMNNIYSREAPQPNLDTSPMSSVGASETSYEKSAQAWRRSGWLPGFLENGLFSLAQIRTHFITIYPDAKSNIDTNVTFNGAKDILMYMPRALEVALLAPFPNTWFSVGHTKAGSFMRWISGVEMIVVYVALLFLPFSIWKWRSRGAMWVALTFAFNVLLVYGLVFVNIGTLYRMRYCYIMILTSLGILGAVTVWAKFRAWRTLNQQGY